MRLLDQAVQLFGLRETRVQPKRFPGLAPGLGQTAGAGSRSGKAKMGADKLGPQGHGMPEVAFHKERLAELHGQFAKCNRSLGIALDDAW